MKARALIVGEYMALYAIGAGIGFWMMVEAMPK